MLTVAFPTYSNQQIIHIALEGLCRQKDSPDWELIILECSSMNEVGGKVIKQYAERLKKANCKKIKYIYSQKKLALNHKWIEIAKNAEGEVFCLQASDDYPHPERNKLAYEAIAEKNNDWYDCSRYYSYHIGLNKLVLFNNFESKEWKTGFDISVKTEAVKNIKPGKELKSGVDFWLYENIKPEKKQRDNKLYRGVSTTGLNTVSLRRERYFQKTTFPFQPTSTRLETINLPKSSVELIKSMKQHIDINKKPIWTVKFKKQFHGRHKGQILKVNYNTMNHLFMHHAIDVIRDKPFEENFEIKL